MGEVPTVRTTRLLLRAWRESDRAPFAALNADARVMEHFPQLYSRQRSDALVDQIQQHWQQRGYGLWAVERVDASCFIGFVGLCSATFETSFTPCVEVGWRLAADQWGQGLASEGAAVALEFGFTILGLAEIVSFTAQTNVRSWRLMERLRMVRAARAACRASPAP